MIDEKIKIKIINKYINGSTVNEILNEYNIAKSSIYKWIKDYEPMPLANLDISKRELYLLREENKV